MKRGTFKKRTYAEAVAARAAKPRRQAKPPKRNARGKSAAEKRFDKTVRERDGYRCRWTGDDWERRTGRCFFRDEHITVHHIRERTQRPDLKTDPANGACLCNRHHDYAHHNHKGRAQAMAQGLLGGETYEYRDRTDATTKSLQRRD